MFIAINASNSISKGLLQINNQKKNGQKDVHSSIIYTSKEKRKRNV